MKTPTSISLQSFEGNTLDYVFLKEKGIEYIESMASELWTDYNTHDPGITILDMLCYAITDLAARTQLPIEDLLAESTSSSFFTAKEILPNKALTPKDYRKLLIDRPNVRDVRLGKAVGNAIGLFFNQFQKTLTYTSKGFPVHLQGLYHVKVEFQGQLNEDWIEHVITSESAEIHKVHFYFDSYGFARQEWLSASRVSTIVMNDAAHPAPVEDDDEADYYDRFYMEVDIGFSISRGRTATLSAYPVWVLLKKQVLKDDSSVIAFLGNSIRNHLTTRGPDNPIEKYRRRLQAAKQELQGVTTILQANRNLCEDWSDVGVFDVQKVGICIEELEIHSGFDPDEVIGHIYLAVDQFLSPFIKHESLAELLEKGVLPEHIFEGPLLKNGFLSDDRIKQIEKEGNIYTSDIIALIMNLTIEGHQPVIGVRGLELVSYINRHKVANGVRNCLRPRDLSAYKLKFSSFHSKINVKQVGLDPQTLDSFEVGVRIFGTLKIDFENFLPPGIEDLPIPSGKKRGVGRYHSIQHDFPNTYKLKKGSITAKDPPLRDAQSKQLKAYLLFFEQLLANYCTQLSKLQEVFSSDPVTAQTYFFQPLNSVPDIQKVILDFTDYTTHLGKINETPTAFLEKRNKMVDHLLARFGESFAEYAAVMYRSNNTAGLLLEKLDFYHNAPELGAIRACATNYCLGSKSVRNVWDTTNVSGFERRIAVLLGIKNFQRKSLSIGHIYDHIEKYDEVDNDGIDEARFRVYEFPVGTPTNKILLSSSARYPLDAGYDEEIENVIEFATDRGNYEMFTSSDHKYYFNLLDSTGAVIARRIEPFDTFLETEREITRVIELFQGKNEEGFHLLEHILLRPKDATYELLPTTQIEYDSANSEETYIETRFRDPYSFQVSIIFPLNTGRFKNAGFRSFVERMIHLELPAHIYPHIYWVMTGTALADFEQKYKSWLEGLCAKQRLKFRTNRLINSLNNLINASIEET